MFRLLNAFALALGTVLLASHQPQPLDAAAGCDHATAPAEYYTEDEKQSTLYFLQKTFQMELRSGELDAANGSAVDVPAAKTVTKTTKVPVVLHDTDTGQTPTVVTTDSSVEKPDSKTPEKANIAADPIVKSPEDVFKWLTTHGKPATANATANATEEGNEAFANKQQVSKNVTRVLNISGRPGGSANITVKETITEDVVLVASPYEIITVFICMFAPLCVAWAIFVHLGSQEKHLMIMLPLTYGACSIGFDLVNQSLGLVMGIPASITAIQALSMGIVMLIWTVSMESAACKEVPRSHWLTWMLIAFVYGLYQLSNHFTYEKCSLSERTVFMNLCPAAALCLEILVLPASLQKTITFKIKLALCCMIIGAVLFSIQNPAFTLDGMASATVLVATIVPTRLMQKAFLGSESVMCVPISALVCIDGLVVSCTSAVVAISEIELFLLRFDEWKSTAQSSLVLMLFLSIVTQAAGHLVALLMLRRGSTPTAVIVYGNVTNFVNVALGIVWFGDMSSPKPGAVIGLVVSLACGVWYSVESVWDDYRAKELSELPEPEPKSADAADKSESFDQSG